MSGLINVIRKGAKKPIPLFSRVDEAAQELPRPKGTGKEFMTELKKQPGVKKAELEDRKLAELEKAPKMTKQEFIDKLKEKPAPKIEETIKANPTDADLDEKAMELIEKKADEMAEDKFGKISRFNRQEWNEYQEGAVAYLKDREYDKYLREAKRDIEENGGISFPKFQDWKLPGGENYREILLRLPQQKDDGSALAEWQKRMLDKYGTQVSVLLTDAEKAEGIRLREAGEKKSASNYKSSHWEEPNVLAHMRVQDRVGPNGEKILHVEEIQSDWHQEGRKKGYATGREEQDYIDYLKDLEQRAAKDIKKDFLESGVEDARAEQLAQKMASNLAQDPRKLANFLGESDRQMELHKTRMEARDKTPDAPFKKNWHELATKKLMNYAIENGYDKVAFTPGAEQAERYKLSKHIDSIMLVPNPYPNKNLPYYFKAFDKNGNRIADDAVDEAKLQEYIGKEPASQLLSSPANPLGERMISGANIVTGGEGMKGFYDKIIPNYLTNEYGKYGASVGTIQVPVGEGMVPDRAGLGMIRSGQPEYKDLHSIDITPQMREAIEAKGQPLYQAVGVGLTGAAAAPKEEVHFSDNPDAMMMEMEDRGFAGGGLLKKAAKAIKGTQEVLPAAEREANKAKFLEDSKVKDVLYRGQRRVPKADKFITTQDRSTPSFTTDPEVANVYSRQLDWNVEHGPGSTSVPVHLKTQKPFDIRNLGEHVTLDELIDRVNHDLSVPTHAEKLGYEDLADILWTLDHHVFKGNASHNIDARDSKGHKIRGFDRLADEIMKAGEEKDIERILYDLLPNASVDAYALADNPNVVNQLKKQGYDSMIHKDVFDAGMPYYKGDPNNIEGGYDAEHVIDAYRPFEQTKIKSAIGNRGTYDTTDPDITKAKGGLTMAKRK